MFDCCNPKCTLKFYLFLEIYRLHISLISWNENFNNKFRKFCFKVIPKQILNATLNINWIGFRNEFSAQILCIIRINDKKIKGIPTNVKKLLEMLVVVLWWDVICRYFQRRSTCSQTCFLWHHITFIDHMQLMLCYKCNILHFVVYILHLYFNLFTKCCSVTVALCIALLQLSRS